MAGSSIIPAGVAIAVGKRFAKPFLKEYHLAKAEKLFGAFIQAFHDFSKMKTPQNEEQAYTTLERLMKDKGKQKLIMSAFRRANQAISEDLGPVIQMMLLAEIIAEDREINIDDELIFGACDILNDKYIVRFCEFVEEVLKGDRYSLKKHEVKQYVTVEEGYEIKDTNNPVVQNFNIADKLGIWALKAEQAGIIDKEIIKEKEQILNENRDRVEGFGIYYCVHIAIDPERFCGFVEKAEKFINYMES